MLRNIFSLVGILVMMSSYAQDLPLEMRITPEGHLISGGNPTTGFYNPQIVNKLEITLSEPNWFELLDGTRGPGGSDGETLIGVLTFNDTLVLDSVLVSIKGQTSDQRNNSEKKSFKIEIDEIIDQDLLGYDNLNLNCAYEDHSSMREVLYYDISRSFAPALKGNFVDLYINGESWGPYNNIQQIEGRYIKEWFTDNEGTRWRAVTPDGIGGQGNPFGTGVSTLNYNGPDSTDYNRNYTLKKYNKDNPWEDLIEACDVLNNMPISDLYEELSYVMDVDRALWFLAQETVFSDDDSYINKGGMDYYVYWDNVTDRIIPLEVDGNSVMTNRHVNWSPFYHENDTDFPLLNRLLKNEEARQRYLAHLRTVLENHFVENHMHDRIDQFVDILDQRVQDDPKKIYSYNQFVSGIEDLKDFISDRIQVLSSNSEIDRQGLEIVQLNITSDAGDQMPPLQNEEPQVSAKIEGDAQKVVLYYATGFDGKFDRTEMWDDGTNGDQIAGDNIYYCTIPGFASGQYVRYYVEAIKNDAFATASYFPKGAEHDVFIYQVQFGGTTSSDLVINELMADNDATVQDNAGEYDDWVELYNNSDVAINLTGYYMSDKENDVTKWQFPDNTIIEPFGYLIIWADEDDDQTTDDDLHADFKLSADGEVVLIANPDEEIVDYIEFGEQQEDVSFARIPNGVGDFELATPTFNANNDLTTSNEELNTISSLEIYPNPAHDQITLDWFGTDDYFISIFNSVGQKMYQSALNETAGTTILNVSSWATGMYMARLNNADGEKIEQKIIVVTR